MPLIINTNIDSLNAQRQLSAVNIRLARTFQRLSSGLRINRAADDAAGLAIAEELQATVRGSRKAIQNAQDGIALMNVADGASQSIMSNLQRMRELTKQAANDTYDVNKRGLIQEELDQLKNEITRIANGTTFNGVNLLNSAVPTRFVLQIGANNDTSTGGVDIVDIASALGDLTASVGLSLGTTSVATNSMANQLASRIDAAISVVNSRLARLGAFTNRLEGIIANLETFVENTAAAESRIRDADIALETATLTKNQILQQSTIAILSQANAQPQAALQLLQG
ncbi:MAG: flagellin FliC [Cyanobacteria bacterium HKST-UBA04]|nr:flagellin FliC [Cyanobacteria bacterium HKST-UBA04]MCA9842202.1 flagellin FliC [Cyanobacteria bacterium HKST-UBA03]